MLTQYLFSDWLKEHSEFSKSAPVTSSSCKDTQGDSRSWVIKSLTDGDSLRVIMSISCALCEEAKT